MSDTEALVRAYLAAVAARDFELSRTYLANRGFSYVSPIGVYQDADRFIKSIAVIGPILERLDIRKCMTLGNEAIVIMETVTTLNGYESHPTAMLFEVMDHHIQRIEAIFDASDYHRMFSLNE